MKRPLKPSNFYHLINHGNCVLITSGTKLKPNVTPIAWITPVNDDPPLLAISVADSHYISELINKTKQFVLNIPNIELLEAIKITGSVTGKTIDKFYKADLTAVSCKKIDTVYIKECIGHIECRLYKLHRYDGVTIFIGKVVHAEIESNFYNGYIIPEKAKTIHHIGNNKFMVSTRCIKQ